MFERHVGLFKTLDGRPVRINKVGMGDVWFLYPGEKCIYGEMEFKTGKAVQSKAQKVWQKFIESMGGVYILVRDEKEALKEIKRVLTNN